MTNAVFQTIILLILFQLCSGQPGNQHLHKTNAIDSIQNTTQIARLLAKADERYKNIKIDEEIQFTGENCQKHADSLKIQAWTKADFDHNGLTDLLVIGSGNGNPVLCMLDKGQTYEVNRITRSHFQECTFPVVENNKIKYYFEGYPEIRTWDEKPVLKEKILIYTFGDFIEENKNPANHTIEKIEYSTGPCYGNCPVFYLTINSDKTAKWFAEVYNYIAKQELEGTFQTKITQNKFDEIIHLLNYIDFEKLKDTYSVNWTDDQTSTLTITYDNGKTKSIKDYGLLGTYGLDRVYQLLFELRENQKWVN